MPTYAGDVVNGKWYAQSPYGATNASGGVNVAPYGPWNGMPASGYSPVIGTPTNFNVGGAAPTVPTIPGLTTAAGGSTSGGLPSLPPTSAGPSTGLSNYDVPGLSPVASTLNTSGGTVGSSTGSATGVGGYSPGAAPNLGSLTQMINQLNLQGQQAANAGRIPGEQGLETQSSGMIGQELAGQLPQDVITQLQQQAAERGIATGSPGSDNSNAAYLRALGLTSLQEQQQGQQNLTAAEARNPAARVFDPTSQLLTPAQAGQLNNENAMLQLDWYKALTGQGGGRGSGGGGQPTTQDSGTTGLPSWFPTAGGTTSPIAGPTGGGVTQDPNYPGTSVPGLTNLTNILGTADPGYGLSPNPAGQTPFGGDASNPNYWDFTTGAVGGYDPFAQL